MQRSINLKGQRFGRLIVLSKMESTQKSLPEWLCKCDCGNETIVKQVNLRTGRTRSCGCLHKDILRQRNRKMGTTNGMYKLSIYSIWRDMLQRCNNPNNSAYKNYGGRGITVCKRWLKFENFYADMGDRPKSLTLGRINNEKGYFPDNCSWSTMKAQANNKRNNIKIKFQNQYLTLKEWSEKIGMKYPTLARRIKKYHWPIEKALTKPIGR